MGNGDGVLCLWAPEEEEEQEESLLLAVAMSNGKKYKGVDT